MDSALPSIATPAGTPAGGLRAFLLRLPLAFRGLMSGRMIALTLLGWSAYVFATSFIAWTYIGATEPSRPAFWYVVRVQAVAPVVWLLLTPVILAAARRWEFRRGHWRVPAMVHAALGLAIHILVMLAERGTWTWITARPLPPLEASLVSGLVFRLFLYGGIVATTQAAQHHRRFVEGRTQALELRAQLLDAQVRALSLQLEPHFLFNTLHAISELVHQDADRADRAIMRLADLLRRTTALGGRAQVPLEDELLVLHDYADLLHLRWGDGLRITIEADASIRGVAVPPLLLQPLVENAVRHGIGGRAHGRVEVRARRDGDSLVLVVEDDGRGFGAGAIVEGVGLRNTRLRLSHLHGDAADVTLGSSALGGARVTLRLPAGGAPEGEVRE